MGAFPGFLFRKSATPAAGTFQPIRNRVWSVAIASASMQDRYLTEAGGVDSLNTFSTGTSYTANTSQVRYLGKHYVAKVNNGPGAFDADDWFELRPLSYFAALVCDPSQRSGSRTGADVYDQLKADNPAIRLHVYTYFIGAKWDGTDSHGLDAQAWLDANNGWLYTAAAATGDGTGGAQLVTPTRSQGLTGWRTVNTAVQPTDSNGRDWGEWNAYAHTITAPWDTRRWSWFVDDCSPLVNRATGSGDLYNYAFTDDLGTGYWRQSASETGLDSDVVDLWRESIRRFCNDLRAARPGSKVIINSFGKLPASWDKTGADHYYFEATLGYQFANENDYAAAWQQNIIKEVGGDHCAKGRSRWCPGRMQARQFNGDTTSPATQDHHKNFLYGLASCLLTDAGFSYQHTDATATAYQRFWFAEYDVDLGVPLEPMPTAAWSNGVWKREYQNGMVLVNPRLTHSTGWADSANDKTVTLPAGPWRRLTGTLDPADDGSTITQATLLVRSGLILLRA